MIDKEIVNAEYPGNVGQLIDLLQKYDRSTPVWGSFEGQRCAFLEIFEKSSKLLSGLGRAGDAGEPWLEFDVQQPWPHK